MARASLRGGMYLIRWLAAGLGAAATTLALLEAGWGSGFQLRENSVSALGSAFAGAAASTEDPSVIANNPAGMIGLSGNQIYGATSIIIPAAVFSGTGMTAGRQPISGGNGGNAGSAQPIPAAYGFYDASPNLKLALRSPRPSASHRNTMPIGSGGIRRSSPK